MPNTARSIYLPLLTAGHFFSDFYANFLPALLPLVIASLNLSLTSSGILVMVFSFSSSILQPFCGFYLDKTGNSYFILLTLPLSALFICTINYVSSYSMLLVVLLLSGIASSFFHPLASLLLTKVTLEKSKGLAMSIFIAGGNLGFALAPAIIIYFLVVFGFSSLPFLMIPGFVLTLLYLTYNIHKIDIKNKLGHTPSTSKVWYTSPDLIKLNIAMGLRSWPQVTIPTFLPIFLAQQGLSTTLAGNLLTVFLLSGAVGGLIGGYIGDRFGRKTCTLLSLCLCLPASYLFFLSTEITWLSWLCIGISGATLQSPVPSSIVWAQKLLPENGAMASGMMLGLAFGLGGLGAALTGYFADLVGLHQALLLTLLPLIAAIALTLVIRTTTPAAYNKPA